MRLDLLPLSRPRMPDDDATAPPEPAPRFPLLAELLREVDAPRPAQPSERTAAEPPPRPYAHD